MIKDVTLSNSEIFKIRSQTISNADSRNKGRDKVNDPPIAQPTKVMIDRMIVLLNIQEEEQVESQKKRKRIHGSDLGEKLDTTNADVKTSISQCSS